MTPPVTPMLLKLLAGLVRVTLPLAPALTVVAPAAMMAPAPWVMGPFALSDTVPEVVVEPLRARPPVSADKASEAAFTVSLNEKPPLALVMATLPVGAKVPAVCVKPRMMVRAPLPPSDEPPRVWL